MRTTFIALVLVLLGLTVANRAAAQGRFGAGFMFGEPTGLSWKYRINQSNALDGGIGFSPFDRYRLHADYLWQTLPFRDPNVSLYYGVGAAVGFGSTHYIVSRGYLFTEEDEGFAARVPIGISYNIPRSPAELFVEAAPMMIFAPDAALGLDGAFGARFTF